MDELLEWMDYIEDKRQQTKVRHKLKDIIVIVLFATLANVDDWVEMEYFAHYHEAYLKKYRLNHKFCGISDSSRSSVGSYRIASERNIRHQDIRIPVCEES